MFVISVLFWLGATPDIFLWDFCVCFSLTCTKPTICPQKRYREHFFRYPSNCIPPWEDAHALSNWMTNYFTIKRIGVKVTWVLKVCEFPPLLTRRCSLIFILEIAEKQLLCFFGIKRRWPQAPAHPFQLLLHRPHYRRLPENWKILPPPA